MKYTLSLDVPRSKDWGLNLSEAALFSWLYSVPSWANNAIIEGEVWYFASRFKAIEDTGGVITDKPDTIYRLYKSLEAKGLIGWKKLDGKDYINITATGQQWNSDEKTEVGKKSEQTRKNFRKNSEKNPIYYSISDDEISDESAPAKISQPKDNPIPVTASQAAPDWMDVARQMLEYSRGEGATQYRFLCESMRFSGDPMPVFTAWASKAAPYELKNWKAEFRKLGTWFRNEATRGQAYKPVSNATEQPTIRREL